MDDFMKFIKKAQTQELEELEIGLKKNFEGKKKELSENIKALESSLETEKKRNEKISSDRDKFNKLKSEKFTEIKTKEELARKYFFELVDKKLGNKTYFDEWIKEGEKQVKNFEKGEIKKDKNGFVFENENLKFEFTKDTYFGKIFEENKAKLIKVLFK